MTEEMIRLEIPFIYDGLVREILDEFEWNYQIFFNGNAKMYHEEGDENPSAEGSFKEGSYENYAYYNFQRFGTIAPTTFPARLEWSERAGYIKLECCFDSTKPERMMMLYRLHQESSRQPEDYAEAYLDTCPSLELNWMTAAEATQLWGLGASTIRQAIHEKRFLDGECRKSGSVWLVKESAMKRLYGEPKKKLDIDKIEAILEIQNLSIDFESFNTGDELADWLDGRKFPGFDEPMEVTEEQRAALREIYDQN